MSTTDPIEARRRREAATIGSPGALALVVFGLVLVAIGAALLARAMFGFAEIDETNPTAEPPLAVFGLAAGIPILLAGTFIQFGASRRFTGKLMSSPGIGVGPILFLGLAIGAWWGTASLPSPGAAWLIPVAVTIIAVLLLVAGVTMRARRRASRTVLEQLVLHGLIVQGVIVEIPTIDASSGGLIAPVTVKFTDAAGTERWVQKAGQWKRADLPATGDAAAVLYDPSRPDDTERIWVGPLGSITADDFRRWHSEERRNVRLLAPSSAAQPPRERAPRSPHRGDRPSGPFRHTRRLRRRRRDRTRCGWHGSRRRRRRHG